MIQVTVEVALATELLAQAGQLRLREASQLLLALHLDVVLVRAGALDCGLDDATRFARHSSRARLGFHFNKSYKFLAPRIYN